MASRNDRDRRDRRNLQGHHGDHSIGSRDTWRGGGEFGIGQFEQEQYRSRERWSADDDRDDRDDDRHGHHRGWVDRILGRGDDDERHGDSDRDDRHHRSWWSRLTGDDHDDDDRDRERRMRDRDDDRGLHRSWFGADDYDDDVPRRARHDRSRDDDDAREMRSRFRGARDVDDRVGWVQRGSEIGRIYSRDEDERLPRRSNRELSDRNMGTRERMSYQSRDRDRDRDRDQPYGRYGGDHDDMRSLYMRGGTDLRDSSLRGDIGGMRRTDVTPLGNPALGQVRTNRDVNLLRGTDRHDRYSYDRDRGDRYERSMRDDRSMQDDRSMRDDRWARHNRQLRDDRANQHRGGYASRQWDEETRSRWRSQPVDIDRRNYTDEDDDDRRLRGFRGDYDTRSRQFASSIDDVGDDMRGQFHRSRNDGELGRRGFVEEVRMRDANRDDMYRGDRSMNMNRGDMNRDDMYRGDRSMNMNRGDMNRGDMNRDDMYRDDMRRGDRSMNMNRGDDSFHGSGGGRADYTGETSRGDASYRGESPPTTGNLGGTSQGNGQSRSGMSNGANGRNDHRH